MPPTATFTIDRPTPGIAVVTINGSLDAYSAPDVRSFLIDATNEGHHRLVVDLTKVNLIDSTGLGVLVGASKRALAHGGALTLVVDPMSSAWRALRVTGVHKTIPHAKAVDEALALLELKPGPNSGPQLQDERVWLHGSPHIHATRLSRDRRLFSVCGRAVSTIVGGDEVLRDGAEVTCRECLRIVTQAAEPLWPPQVGDVWLGRINEPSPKAWVCDKPGMLSGVHNWTTDETWDKFGPLRLVWRDGAVVTATEED